MNSMLFLFIKNISDVLIPNFKMINILPYTDKPIPVQFYF